MEVPYLPRDYELVVRDSVDSALEEAARLARAGADEGTLVWAREQTAGRDQLEEPWPSPQGNLYCALVLRPEYPVSAAMQLAYVAAVSLGNALADIVPPMNELHYHWPNELMLNGAKVAAVFLNSGPIEGDRLQWLVLGVSVNVRHHAETPTFAVTSLHGEGCTDASEGELLGEFGRHFLSWINRWADSGFAPVHRAWIQRAINLGSAIEVRLANETARGRFVEVDTEGALVLEPAVGGQRRVTVAEFFGISG